MMGGGLPPAEKDVLAMSSDKLLKKEGTEHETVDRV